MKIAFSARRPVHPFAMGGAELSMHVLFNHLARLDHSCMLCGELTDDPRIDGSPWRTAAEEGSIVMHDDRWPNRMAWSTSDGVQVTVTGTSGFERFITEELDRFAPDHVLTHLDGALETLLWAQMRKTESTFFVRDIVNPYNWIPFTTPWIEPGQIRVVSNSRFVQQHLQSCWEVSSAVLYPPIERPRHRPRKEPPKKPVIAFVNPAPSKGGVLVHDLALRVPEFDFQVVEGWVSLEEVTWDWPPNVKLIRKRPSLDDVFAAASAVIVPSQEPEAFCRVVPEAQARSTPVLASAHTGLVEALGDGGILIEEYQNVAAWEHMLCVLHNDKDVYRQCMDRGWDNAARFDADLLSRQFLRQIEEGLEP